MLVIWMAIYLLFGLLIWLHLLVLFVLFLETGSLEKEMQNRVNLNISYNLTSADGNKMADGDVNWNDLPYEAAVEIQAALVKVLEMTVNMGRQVIKK